MEEWIPAITTTSIFGGLLWLGRSLIITRLKNSVKYEFDRKLEVIRSELKSKEAQIESLRSGAMSGLITRQGALYQRKIQAIDQIWSSVKELEKGKYISSMLGSLNIEESMKQSGRDLKFTDFINTIACNFDLADLDMSGSKFARPFLTPLAWAYYSAYFTVIIQAAVITNILKIGVPDPEKYLKLENSSNLLKAVLPSWSDYIDQHGISGHHHLLDEVEKLLLAELKNMQDGHEDDKENTIRAAKINQEVKKVSNEIVEFQASA